MKTARHVLTGTDRAELAAGDVFVIETPGGGGYGNPGVRSLEYPNIPKLKEPVAQSPIGT